MFDKLQEWSQFVTPEWQATLLEIGTVLVAFLAGQILGRKVARALAARGFDEALRLSEQTPAARTDPDANFCAAWLIGWLVRFTVWAGAAWWVAQRHGRLDAASTLELVLRRSWAVALVLTASLALGSLLARRLIDCVRGVMGESSSRNGAATSLRSVAGVVGVLAYGLAGLVILLLASDTFDWPLTRTAALSLWQLAQTLLTAGAALFIACLGARSVRTLATPEPDRSPDKRAGDLTATGIVAGTTIVAVTMVLFSSGGLVIALLLAAVLAVACWLLRGYLPDLAAGLQLRTRQVRQVWFDGLAWDVFHVGLLATEVCRQGEFHRAQNRHVLEARVKPQSAAVAAR
jgi:hypothetical protein